MVFVLGSE
jgi:hypothetical protein